MIKTEKNKHMRENVLYWQDCKLTLQNIYEAGQRFDLVYIDPPFNSNRTYNIIHGGGHGEKTKAFKDTWHYTEETKQMAISFRAMLSQQDNISSTVKHFLEAWISDLEQKTNQEKQLIVYLLYMTERIILIHKVLRDTGSFFLHCDPTASHYLKIVLDGIFGSQNFRNEIVWCYKSGGSSRKRFSRKHDIIFWYSKTDEYYYNGIKEKSYHGESYNTGNKNVVLYDDKDGKGKYTLVNPKDWWQVGMMATSSNKRTGLETQKPIALLNKIVLAASKENDLVLDAFCGSGTTIDACVYNKRRWVGIDISIEAVGLVKERLGLENDQIIDGSRVFI